MVVADGMGGHNAGEIASCMAAEEVLRTVEEGGMGGPAEISRAVERANSMVYEHSRSDSGCSGMGTTLVLALGGEGEAIVANVGDSRAYHFSHASGEAAPGYQGSFPGAGAHLGGQADKRGGPELSLPQCHHAGGGHLARGDSRPV